LFSQRRHSAAGCGLRQEGVRVKAFAFERNKQITLLQTAAVGVYASNGAFAVTHQHAASKPLVDLFQG
jgi:hypothetical protein